MLERNPISRHLFEIGLRPISTPKNLLNSNTLNVLSTLGGQPTEVCIENVHDAITELNVDRFLAHSEHPLGGTLIHFVIKVPSGTVVIAL